VAYYLKRLADQSDANRKSQVRVPGQDRLTAIIEPLFEACREDSIFYCVADLEEAVNRAYSRSARRAWPDGGWTQESPELEIHLTEDDLKRSLIEVPKSIRKDALDQFLEDLNRFCDREVAESISSRLRPRSET
jgi:hypothetical protein